MWKQAFSVPTVFPTSYVGLSRTISIPQLRVPLLQNETSCCRSNPSLIIHCAQSTGIWSAERQKVLQFIRRIVSHARRDRALMSGGISKESPIEIGVIWRNKSERNFRTNGSNIYVLDWANHHRFARFGFLSAFARIRSKRPWKKCNQPSAVDQNDKGSSCIRYHPYL